MLTVFLVDDHEMVRRGMVDLLEEEADLKVVGQASSVAEALARVPTLIPDLVVLDVRLPDGNGVELCRELRSGMPTLNCLMFTSYTDEDAMMEAILAGPGYVIKDIKGYRAALGRGEDQPADRRAHVPGRKDREELRVPAVHQARYGATHPSRRAGHRTPRPGPPPVIAIAIADRHLGVLDIASWGERHW